MKMLKEMLGIATALLGAFIAYAAATFALLFAALATAGIIQ